MLRHPRWCVDECIKQTSTVRAEGTARFNHRLPRIYHHRLDSRLERLPVELGAASCVDYGKAMIVTRLCKLLRPRKVLEIGTYRGGMTAHIARNTPEDCEIWTIDLPREHQRSMTAEMLSSDVELAEMDISLVGREWARTSDAHKIHQLWGDSMTYDFSDLAPVNLVYIDGSHAERWVQKDTENAFSVLAPTGAILWDDCLWRGVQRVLGRFARDKPIYRFEDNSTAGYVQIDGKPISVGSRSFF